MNVNNTLVPQQQEEGKIPFSSYIAQEQILSMVKSTIGEAEYQPFVTSIVSSVSANPDLAKCLYSTILSAAMVGKALNLSPSPVCGQYFMVPFKNEKLSKAHKKEIYEAQFVIGYKGYLQLAYRTGVYKRINAVPIKEGEYVRWDPIEEKLTYNLIGDDMEREEAKTVGYYAYYEYLSGTRKAIYWSKEKMLRHADTYAPAFSMNAKTAKNPKYNRVSFADYEAGKYPKDTEWLYSSYWYKSFDDMGCKTMLRQLIGKWGVMSVELEKAFMYDGAVIDEQQQPHFLDDADLETLPIPDEPIPLAGVTVTPVPIEGYGSEELTGTVVLDASESPDDIASLFFNE